MYCRACGENKTHDFKRCKNISSIKSIVYSQDNELDQLNKVLAENGVLKRDLENVIWFMNLFSDTIISLNKLVREIKNDPNKTDNENTK